MKLCWVSEDIFQLILQTTLLSETAGKQFWNKMLLVNDVPNSLLYQKYFSYKQLTPLYLMSHKRGIDSVYQDQTTQNAASDQGLRCLH